MVTMQLIKRILFSCFLLSVLWTTSANGDVVFDVTPTEINTGSTESLDVTCSFSTTEKGDIALLISLIVSRAESMYQPYTELATLSDYNGNNVNVLTTEDVTAVGSFDASAESSVHLKWASPTGEQAGAYKCSVQGMGPQGHIVVLHKEVQVNADVSGTEQTGQFDWSEKVNEMDQEIKNLKQMVEELVQTSISQDACCKTNQQRLITQSVSLGSAISGVDVYSRRLGMEVAELTEYTQMKISALEAGSTRLEDSVSGLIFEKQSVILERFEEPLTYLEHKYYISKEAYTHIDTSIATCHAYGGWLVEIDDVDEYRAIQTFLAATSDITHVVISGTDQANEGVWVFPSTNKPLPFLDWSPINSDEERGYNCLVLSPYQGEWRMYDLFCDREGSLLTTYRYMCEIPSE